ncbi:MAG: 2,4-dienoyl-CoA reductase (NADPH) [Syntrophorhabdus sp. PtaU1.Bin153]|nr:MAG: 2,4-dienoyl-CoA reductase (NADPH) [Syntrophorhabdus sp. PtaU1.Bin153]
MNKSLTSRTVEAEEPDLVVVATGAAPSHIDLPGIDMPHVVDAWDVLSGSAPYIGKKIVIIGGGATGCEAALFIATMDTPTLESFGFLVFHEADDFDRLRNLLYKSGRRITVVEIAEKLASGMGNSTRWSLLKNLKQMGVELRVKTRIVSIGEKGIVVETLTGTEIIDADTVIIAAGSKSRREFGQEMKDNGIGVIILGDAKEPRRILDAVREGFDEALKA